MVHFVGAGPGAADLITVRGKKLIEEADVIIYAGSLVNPALLEYAKKECRIYDSKTMNLAQVIKAIEDAEKEGLVTVRLHTGDPSLYGAVREQMDILDEKGITYDSTPGVSSFCGAAAALNMEYTLPGISQSLIITRMEGRTAVPKEESVRSLASHRASMVFFLSSGNCEGLRDELLSSGMDPDTPCAVVYKATWPDEQTYKCSVKELPDVMRKNGIRKTALIIVGDAVAQKGYQKSKLYDESFSTEFRTGTDKNECY